MYVLCGACGRLNLQDPTDPITFPELLSDRLSSTGPAHRLIYLEAIARVSQGWHLLFLSLAFFSPKVVFFSCFAVAGFQGTLKFPPLCTVPATEVLGRMCGVRVVYDLM
jgi:hypothetical protein